jgi:TonB family protein
MSTAATPARTNPEVNRRRVARHALTVPVNVAVLRAGEPHNIPGRALNVSEAGMFAALAAELYPGDPVIVAFRFPGSATLLQAKAVVRHTASLQFGIEFVGLSPKQQALIRQWAEQQNTGYQNTEYQSEDRTTAPLTIQPAEGPDSRQAPDELVAAGPRRIKVPRRLLFAAFAGLLIVGGLAWWQWHRAWKELESRVPARHVESESPRVTVPSEAMEQLVIHKVDPVYPDAARAANVQGVVVLDAVIGIDGAVVALHSISGPEQLATAAMDAVKWWRFQPYRLNGKPVEVETTITLDFRAD